VPKMRGGKSGRCEIGEKLGTSIYCDGLQKGRGKKGKGGSSINVSYVPEGVGTRGGKSAPNFTTGTLNGIGPTGHSVREGSRDSASRSRWKLMEDELGPPEEYIHQELSIRRKNVQSKGLWGRNDLKGEVSGGGMS